MKKSRAVPALSLVSLLAFVALPAFAGEGENTTISEYCTSRSDLGLSHGACVAYFTTRNVAPHDATVCRDAAVQSRLGVSNHGQCVKKMAEMRK
jgi:hypothetical protein